LFSWACSDLVISQCDSHGHIQSCGCLKGGQILVHLGI
jgi:hypothetical protein